MILKKIKLINWHLFTNETITLKGNTLISGENGTGKSTLVDAIYYLLSGGDDKHFNHAANANAKRTLETYMRAKTGIENKEFLRNQSNLISHIVAEYYSPKTHESFVLGVVLELQSGNIKPKVNFYFVNNYEIKEDDYVSNNVVANYNTLKKNIKDLTSLETNGVRKRREAIARDIFKLESSEKYYDLLAKAIAFKPIEEVNSFVNSFLLSEKNISLEGLRSEMRNYKELHETLIREERKLSCLEEFITPAIKYSQNVDDIKYLNVLLDEARVEQLQNKIVKDSELINQKNLEKNTYLSEKETLEKRQAECISEIALYENNEARQALNLKINKLNQTENEHKNLVRNIKNFDFLVSEEDKIRAQIKSKNEFSSFYQKQDYLEFNSSIKNFLNEINKKDEEYRNLRAKKGIEIENNNKKIESISKKLADLNQGIRPYNENLIYLINSIEEEIKKQTKETVKIKPLCEYLEIKEEKKEWTNAIEAYLNTQRFDLIVSPKYFNIAITKYEEIKDKNNIHGFGIVDVSKLDERETNPDSLFDCLEVSNNYALRYAKHLLNNVICVDDVKELNKHKIGITKTCMLYKNYCVRALDKKLYETPYIGRDSLNRQKEKLTNDLSELHKQQNEARNIVEKADDALNILSKSNAKDLVLMDNLWEKEISINNEIKRLSAEIEEDKHKHNLLELEEQIKRAKANLESIKNQIRQISFNISSLEKTIGSIENEIEQNKKELELIEKKFNDNLVLIKADLEKYECYLKKQEEYKTNNHLSYSRISDDLRKKENSNSQNYNFIMRGMQKYSNNYRNELVADINNVDDFINEYYSVKNLDVVSYKDKSRQAYEKCEEQFRQVFLAGIRTNINEAKAEISKLNKNLYRHPFGRDEERYEFVFKPAKDLADYYRIITSGEELVTKDLFTSTLNESDTRLIEDLFNKIAESDMSKETESFLTRYLDYREYMNYDIKVTNRNGDVSYISKTTREKSGGETQTPFYVVIAACFDELMKKNEDACCLVIFDEAFNNMDEGRISNVLEFYKELSIQLFIVVPGVRTYSIAPYMDSVIGIAKSNNRLILFHEPGK